MRGWKLHRFSSPEKEARQDQGEKALLILFSLRFSVSEPVRNPTMYSHLPLGHEPGLSRKAPAPLRPEIRPNPARLQS
jgi:hypothetical protein